MRFSPASPHSPRIPHSTTIRWQPIWPLESMLAPSHLCSAVSRTTSDYCWTVQGVLQPYRPSIIVDMEYPFSEKNEMCNSPPGSTILHHLLWPSTSRTIHAYLGFWSIRSPFIHAAQPAVLSPTRIRPVMNRLACTHVVWWPALLVILGHGAAPKPRQRYVWTADSNPLGPLLARGRRGVDPHGHLRAWGLCLPLYLLWGQVINGALPSFILYPLVILEQIGVCVFEVHEGGR